LVFRNHHATEVPVTLVASNDNGKDAPRALAKIDLHAFCPAVRTCARRKHHTACGGTG
jgi:hypothetical protein